MTNKNLTTFFNNVVDCVGTRKLKIQPNKSFVEIFKKTAYLFQNDKVFLSEKIFEELCKECEQKDGNIQIANFGENNFIYQLRFSDINNKQQKSEINILLKIKGSKFEKKRYELLSFSSTEAKYKNVAPKLSCGFFLDRPKKLKQEYEKC